MSWNEVQYQVPGTVLVLYVQYLVLLNDDGASVCLKEPYLHVQWTYRRVVLTYYLIMNVEMSVPA